MNKTTTIMTHDILTSSKINLFDDDNYPRFNLLSVMVAWLLYNFQLCMSKGRIRLGLSDQNKSDDENICFCGQ